MTPARFREIGEALYGQRWQESLALDLSVSLRTLQRWASGAREIPDIQGELAAIAHDRAREIGTLADELA